MDYGLCKVIYLDNRVPKECTLTEDDVDAHFSFTEERTDPSALSNAQSAREVHSNVKSLLSLYPEVQVCKNAGSCLSLIASANQSHTEASCTIVLIDVPFEDEHVTGSKTLEPRSPSPTTASYTEFPINPQAEDRYGLQFLQYLSSEIRMQNISSFVIPFAILSGMFKVSAPSDENQGKERRDDNRPSDRAVTSMRYLDAGAIDTLTSPLSVDRVQSIPSHVYRTLKDRKRRHSSFHMGRKTSWVGTSDTKPYSYLREMMVAGLMDGICNPDRVDSTIDASDVVLSLDRKNAVSNAVGTWAFSAHDFTDDELLYGAFLMLEHTLLMPELEKWRLDKEQLLTFLIATRRIYNSFVRYHNFRHAVDVLQATFFFLVQIGQIPTFPPTDDNKSNSKELSPISALLKPFHSLTLLISAIGHDVGHPGVNNLFLVTLNAPLAQLYNDRSVLESFHCAAYSQILRRYWASAFSDSNMRKLMINSILATDMGLHVQYMTQLGNLQEKFAHNGYTTDGWNDKILEEYRELLCCLLIKCADICNVARKFQVSVEWTMILTDEFANQGEMEKELHMPSCLFGGPPVKDDVVKLGSAQIGFMNIFAGPLFESVSSILPDMQFSIDEINTNKAIWQGKIEQEKLQIGPKAYSPKIPPHDNAEQSPRGSHQSHTVLPSDSMTSRPLSETPPREPSLPRIGAPTKTPGKSLSVASGAPTAASKTVTDEQRRASLANVSTPTKTNDALENNSRRSSGGLTTPPPHSSPSSRLGSPKPAVQNGIDGSDKFKSNNLPPLDERGRTIDTLSEEDHPSTVDKFAKADILERSRIDSDSSESHNVIPQFQSHSTPRSNNGTLEIPPQAQRKNSGPRKKISFRFWRRRSNDY